MFDQVENVKGAILKRRARLEEIKLIISRPLPKGGSAQHRRNLIEEKLHLELAISELEVALRNEEQRRVELLFRFEDLDRRLISPKTNELAEEMHKRSRHAKKKISFETVRNGNSATYLQRLFDFHEELADEWAARLFIAHCEAWVEQNRVISPSFIRAVSNRRIRELFAAHTSSVKGEVERRAIRINEPIIPAVLSSWRLRMDRLANRWHNRLEAEAAKCGYTTARNVPYRIPVYQASTHQFSEAEKPPKLIEGYPLSPIQKSNRAKTGRRRKCTSDFVSFAGGLWLQARRQEGVKVSEQQLAQIAAELDAKGYGPPADFLERSCATELKTYNSRHSNSKVGPIQTWVQLVSHADKDHLRGMRRRLSRCAAEANLRDSSGN
jgi:hypothetical protein